MIEAEIRRIVRALERANDRLKEYEEVDSILERSLAALTAVVERAGKGNPYHKGKGEEGGQFTSGPEGGGGSTSTKPHGKHWAKRQRRKKRIKRQKRKVAKGYKEKTKGGPKDEARAEAAKATYKPCTKKEKDYSKANEHQFASHIGGKSYPDNGPSDVDVSTKSGGHHLELKSMLTSEQGKANMSREAIGRKIAMSQDDKQPFHMIILDDRNVFDQGANAHLHSGHRMYFKDGVARYNIKDMHPVKDEAEIKRILDTPYEQWPAKAKASKKAVAGVNAPWLKKTKGES